MRDPQTWFAGIAVLVSIVSLWVALWTFVRSRVTSLQPVLVFTFDSRTGWLLRNIGNGPALDIIGAERPKDAGWSMPMRIPPLSPSAQVEVSPLGHHNVPELACSYRDIDGRCYTSVCEHDLTVVQKGRALPIWPEEQIERLWVEPKGS